MHQALDAMQKQHEKYSDRAMVPVVAHLRLLREHQIPALWKINSRDLLQRLSVFVCVWVPPPSTFTCTNFSFSEVQKQTRCHRLPAFPYITWPCEQSYSPCKVQRKPNTTSETQTKSQVQGTDLPGSPRKPYTKATTSELIFLSTQCRKRHSSPRLSTGALLQ